MKRINSRLYAGTICSKDYFYSCVLISDYCWRALAAVRYFKIFLTNFVKFQDFSQNFLSYFPML